MVLNGHATKPNVARLLLKNEFGDSVPLMMANYQRGTLPYRDYGGAGFTRLLRFLPDGTTVEVQTYSPWYDQWLTEEAEAFEVKIAPLRKASAVTSE